MNSDLQHLIHLQDLELNAERIRRRVEDLPQIQAALDERIGERTAVVAAVKERIAANQAARREIEKDLAAVQTRLSKYKDQLMEVKTNKEYQAMQTEIATAEGLVRSYEDRLLDLMEAAEKDSTDLKSAEGAMRSEEAAIAAEQKSLDAEKTTRQADLEALTSERTQVASQISRDALVIFERVSQGRKGIAVAEAKDGLCSVCHVRLRPQVFNEVRRNAAIIQCDSCTRILYFVPPVPAPVVQS